MGVYENLNVRRIINGSGMQTRLSGTLIRPEAMSAMVEASKALVDMEHLQAEASRIISSITGSEAGMVTSGAAAGLTLATAACVTGLDIGKMDRLPDTAGMKNEVIMARHHRNAYDHMIRLVGVKIVEVGLNDIGIGAGVRGVEPWEFEAAITDKTAAIAYVQKPTGRPALEEVTKVAKKNDVPVIVDAAAELPPAKNLRQVIENGADLVVFSGGKAIRGPQSTGILAGRKDLIMAAILQVIDMDSRFETWDPPIEYIDKSRLTGIPRNGIGRGFKVGKEEIAGLLTALRIFADENEEENIRAMEKKSEKLYETLNSVQGIRVKHFPASKLRPLPHVEIFFSGISEPADMIHIIKKLREDSPPIYLDETRVEESVLEINPYNLSEDDIAEITRRIRSIASTL
jgi:D-glucosaminate-6-phosphate ammonia-lyase